MNSGFSLACRVCMCVTFFLASAGHCIAQNQPTLKETLDWLHHRLSNKGYSVVDLSDAVAKTGKGNPGNWNHGETVSFRGCTMTFTYGGSPEIHMLREGEVTKSERTVQLGLLAAPSARAFIAAPQGQWAVALRSRDPETPAMTIRTTVYRRATSVDKVKEEGYRVLLIWMPEQAVSERVRHAFDHAIEVCRKSVKPPTF